MPLLNPYTGERDQPVDTTASSPGEIGYQTNSSKQYYIISGFGDSTLVVEFSNLQELEEQVVLNCYRLMEPPKHSPGRTGDITPPTMPR
ncbi:MAG: hypothetical protein ACQERI_02930 [Candidatus Krumholzibacteriota bacterium]